MDNVLYSSNMSKAKKAAAVRDYRRALLYLDEIQTDSSFDIQYLLLKARYIQLVDSQKYTLLDAEKCLNDALAIDPQNAEVLVELGYFFSSVFPNHQKSVEYFTRALEQLTKMYAEAFSGMMDELDYSPLEIDEAFKMRIKFLKDQVGNSDAKPQMEST